MLPYFKDAIAACDQAFRNQSDVAGTCRTLGNVLQAMGKFDEAMVWHTRAVEADPDPLETFAGLGMLYAEQKEWEAAIAAYEQTIALDPEFDGGYWSLANLYSQMGQYEESDRCRQQAIALNPAWATSQKQFYLGNALVEQNNLDAAIECYQRVIEQESEHFQAHYNLAVALTRKAAYPEAIAAYQRALAINPEHAASHYALGKVLELQQSPQVAVDHYRRAVELQSDSWQLNQQLGEVLKQQEQWPDALKAFDQALALRPNLAWTLSSKGVVLMKLQRWSEAEAALQAAIALKPNLAWAHYYLGQTLERLDRQEAAADCYCQAIKIKPTLHAAYQALGRNCKRRSQYDAAIAAFQKAIEVNPKNPYPYIQLQYTPVSEEQLENLIQFYRRTIQNYPKCLPMIWGNLGDALTKQGNIEEAIRCYQTGCYKRSIATHPNLAQRKWKPQKEKAPDFMIIGTNKAGTTSLFTYLRDHPRMLLPHKKELDFFLDRYFDYGINWYLAHFPSITDQPRFLTGEASPNYLDSVGVEQRIQQFFPEIKLIVLLRNPVDRAISWYYHRVNDGTEKRPLEEAIASETEALQSFSEDELVSMGYRPPNNLLGGLYVYKLKRWMQYFPKEQFLILKSEDLFSQTAREMKKVYQFLDLPPYRSSEYGKYNVGSYSSVAPELRDQLGDFFRPHNQKLEEFLDMEFNWK